VFVVWSIALMRKPMRVESSVAVLGATPGDVDAALAHHPHRVGMQRVRVAARASRADRAAGQLPGEHLGDLRARAIARAQEQHARERRTALTPRASARRRRQGRMQRGAGARQQLSAARQIEDVVAVAAVGGAATHRNQATVAQLAQVVGDQALAPARQLAQLAHAPIAARQLAQQPPPQRVPRQP
jgi:hypothetical protein